MQNILTISNLSQIYKNNKSQIKALNCINLNIVNPGIYGLIGHNGAGKSTLLKCIMGLILPHFGTIQIFGNSNLKALDMLGYMPENFEIHEFMTGREFIEFVAALRNIQKNNLEIAINKLDKILSLPNLNQMIHTYSKGNKEKLLFLVSLMHYPKVLILDEPFTGLDPQTIYSCKKFILNYASLGNTIILSTHILEMVKDLCTRVIIINKGEIKKHINILKENNLEQIYLDVVGDKK